VCPEALCEGERACEYCGAIGAAVLLYVAVCDQGIALERVCCGYCAELQLMAELESECQVVVEHEHWL